MTSSRRYCRHVLTAVIAVLSLGLSTTTTATLGDGHNVVEQQHHISTDHLPPAASKAIYHSVGNNENRVENEQRPIPAADHTRSLVKRSNLRKVFLGRKRDNELVGDESNEFAAGGDVERMQLNAMLSSLQQNGARYHKRPRPFLGKRTPCQSPSWISDSGDDVLSGTDAAETAAAAARFLNEDKRPQSKPFLGKRSVTGSGCDELADFSAEM